MAKVKFLNKRKLKEDSHIFFLLRAIKQKKHISSYGCYLKETGYTDAMGTWQFCEAKQQASQKIHATVLNIKPCSYEASNL